VSTFKTYQPYQLDLELINKSPLRIMDREKRLVAERPFLEALRDMLSRDDGYEIEDLSFTMPALVIRNKDEETRFETRNRDETYCHVPKVPSSPFAI